MVLPFWTEDGTAVAGKDFIETSGELLFLNEEMTKTLKVPILTGLTNERNVAFNLLLGNSLGCLTYSWVTR